jgi:D-lactate dehydrogenase (cytochrome)
VGLLNREDNLKIPDSPSLLMEFHGPSKSYLAEVLSMAEELVQENGGLGFRSGLGQEERDRIWRSRHHAGEAVVRAHPGYGGLIVDAAVPISHLPELIVRADEEVKQSGLPGYIFGHAGDGNIHVILMGRAGEPQDWKTIRRTNEAIVKYALDLGGTITGEHGVGLGKKKFMDQEHGLSLDWMRKIKALFDPQGILNPSKCLPSDPLGQE